MLRSLVGSEMCIRDRANASLSETDLEDLKATETFVEFNFSSELRKLSIPSFNVLTTLTVDYNVIEEIMEISSLFNLQKIGVRLTHKHPSTAVSDGRVRLLASKTGVKTLELIFSFSSEEELFPCYAYTMSGDTLG